MSKTVKMVTYHINSPNNSISKKNKVEETPTETTDTEIQDASAINIENASSESDDDSIHSDDDENSDLSFLILKKSERRSLRKSKILRRRNIDEIERNEAEQKRQRKLVIPHTVVEKIEKNEFELSNMIDEALHFIEGKYLVLQKNEREQIWTAENVYQNSAYEVNDTLQKINSKFMEINDKWKKTSEKEDKLVKYEDIDALRDQSLRLLEQKDRIIHVLMKKLDDLSAEFVNEVSSNSSALNKVEEFAQNKINDLKNEHEKQHLVITKLIKDENQKKMDEDFIEWGRLLDNTINKITSTTVRRNTTIIDKTIELRELFNTHERNIKGGRIDFLKQSIGMDADYRLIQMKCSENIRQLESDCLIMKRMTDEDVLRVAGLKKKIIALQKTKIDLKENLDNKEREILTRIPIIKKQIADINKKIDQRERTVDLIAKKNNCLYIDTWKLQQETFIRLINEVRKIYYHVREYLGMKGAPIPDEKSIEDACSKNIDYNQESVLTDLIRDSLPADTYVYARDKALNKLLMDFFLKNSSFLFDYDLNEVINTSVMLNVQYPYNALSILKLNNMKSWNLIKSKFKPFVMCHVCRTEVNWERAENMSDSFEQNKRTGTILDNCVEKLQTGKSALNMLSTHITRHYANIDKVKESDPLVRALNGVQTDENICRNESKKEHKGYSTIVENDDTPAKKVHRCGNANHELFIDDKHFMPVLIEVLKINRTKSDKKIKVLNERIAKTYDFLEWKLSEDDLREYWSKFIKVIESPTLLLKIMHKAMERYYNLIRVRHTKLSMMKKEEISNEEMRTILVNLESTTKKLELTAKKI